MDNSILVELYKQFPNVRERRGQGNKTFKYVASNDIIDRMNRVFQGNWSVEVIAAKELDTDVLVHVRVTVFDQQPNGPVMGYVQEAFASHPLAKFSTGDKQGQVIDRGNSYRAAHSKALKAAVARWGVGLYMDEEGEEGESHSSTFTASPPAADPSKGNSPFPTGIPTFTTPVFPAPATPLPNTPPSVGKQALPVQEKLAATPPPFTVPKTAVPSKPAEVSPPVAQVQSGSEDRWAAPVVEPPKEMKEPEYLTDVQKVALETILQMNGLKYDETARKVLETNDFPPIEKLLYMQAVKLIQYGNNLKLGK
jgi:hypothetical protein